MRQAAKLSVFMAEIQHEIKEEKEKMKRFWLGLLTVGMILIFNTAVFAVDLKFSGEFFAAGVYLDKTTLTKDDGSSTAFYFQRLRIRNDLVVSPGLSLVTRMDAMERVWGGPRSASGTTLAADSAGTTAENQNIVFDWAFIDYQTPIGIFNAGYMEDGATGTPFGNTLAPAPRIKYAYINGPVALKLAYTKGKDNSYTSVNNVNYYADADKDKYGVEGVYQWKNGKAGLNINYYRYADNRPAPNNYKSTYFLPTPYVMAKIGPVALQAEFNWATGKLKEMDFGAGDVNLENYSGWIDAVATFGPLYFGGTFAYVSGDDPATADKQEGGTLTGGRDWSPNLIMWNYDRSMWIGELASTATATKGFGTSGMTNAFLYQARVGVRPTEKLDIMASLTYANADKKPLNYVSDQYGYEVDITGTYKITNNLAYMLGGGYLFTGDYFKGANSANSVQNDYLIINKLSLTF